ncbi:hypothetical protein [Streptococcus pseudopneumoniae]|uniref:hypothetical protein n=1 Tax=Streptococcus pseudopneumoniae TaxID=257758 RepID=UPI001BB28428|nr:hypothetical protein [Streptococcus pseudopneumoniae]
MATVVFPFWNLIREDVYEKAEILSNDNGTCYVTTSDDIPKTIENCNATPGDIVSVKYGHGLAWAEIVPPWEGLTCEEMFDFAMSPEHQEITMEQHMEFHKDYDPCIQKMDEIP